MDKMPEYKENHVTLWRDGKWVQVAMDAMPKINEEDNSGASEEVELPAGA